MKQAPLIIVLIIGTFILFTGLYFSKNEISNSSNAEVNKSNVFEKSGSNSNKSFNIGNLFSLGKQTTDNTSVSNYISDDNLPTKAQTEENTKENLLCRRGKYNGWDIRVCGNEKDQVITYEEFYTDGSLHYNEKHLWDNEGRLIESHTRDYGSGEGGDDTRTYINNRCIEKYNQISLNDGHVLWGWKHNYCHDNAPYYSTYRR